MAYDVALDLAWKELLNSKPAKDLAVKFLSDEYSLDLEARKIISWYLKPTNFEQIKKEFRKIIHATKKGPGISVGF